MPCSCGGMRRSGLAPSNIAIRHKQTTQVYTLPHQYIQKQALSQQFYQQTQQKQTPQTPPPQQTPQAPPPLPQQTPQAPPPQQIIYQSNRPNFSGNLPSMRRK